MADKANYKCLRCEHEYEDKYTRGVPRELSCPKCGSNSVRRIEKDKVKSK